MTARRLILLVILVAGLLVALFIGTYFARGGAGPRPMIVTAPPPVIPDLRDAPRGPGHWLADVADAATPREPHTSAETLEAYVAERAAAEVEKVGDGVEIRVLGTGVSPVTLRRVTNRLQESRHTVIAPDQHPPLEPERPERPDGETWVTIRWDAGTETSVPWWPGPVRRGTLVADIAGPKGTATLSAELDEKPWLETDPAEVGHPGLTVVSTAPLASMEEAQAVVRQKAIDTLVEQLEVRARSTPQAGRVSHDDARRQAEWAVAEGAVVDEAVVRVDRPYGPVWYGAGLVDSRSERVAPLAAAVVHSGEVRTRTIAATLVAFPGMLLVLGVVYLGLNAVTRGYFRTHLRVAAVAVVAVAVAVMLVVLA